MSDEIDNTYEGDKLTRKSTKSTSSVKSTKSTYYCSYCDATFTTKEGCIKHGEQHEIDDYANTIHPKSSHIRTVENDMKLVRK